jgi:type IV secretion system protein VirB4
MIVGETGSGKSYLSNAELVHLLKYNPEVTIIDAGHSYRKYADAMGGSFIELGVDKKVQLNPFSLTPTPSNLEFLKKFVQMLLEGPGTVALTEWEHRVVFEAIKRLYKNDPEHRRLFDLRWSLPDTLQDRLAPWVEGGQYDMFDNVDDTLALRGQIRVLELEAMKKLPVLRDALLLYALHRIDEQVRGNVLTVIWMEEVAFLAEHPVLRDYINDVLTMGRKRNMMMVLVAQHVGQLKKSGLQRTALSACLTKYILANPNMDKQDMRDLFSLNEVELQMCLNIVKKKQFVIMRPGSTKLVELNDPANHWLYSPDETSRAR